jgi:hypothetical protein
MVEMQSQGIPQKQIDAYMMGAKSVTAEEKESPARETAPSQGVAAATGQEGEIRETTVPVPDAVFDRVGVEKGNVYADYGALQKKYSDQFSTAGDVQKHVEYVMENPTHILPATKDEYVLMARTNGKDKAAVVEFVLRGGKYRVRSAFNMAEGQLEAKIEKAQRGSSEPPASARSPQGEISSESPPVSSDTGRVEPSSAETLADKPLEVKSELSKPAGTEKNLPTSEEAAKTTEEVTSAPVAETTLTETKEESRPLRRSLNLGQIWRQTNRRSCRKQEKVSSRPLKSRREPIRLRRRQVLLYSPDPPGRCG